MHTNRVESQEFRPAFESAGLEIESLRDLARSSTSEMQRRLGSIGLKVPQRRELRRVRLNIT
eukprot:6204176-Pleurochrysis_carterae.AAC.3